MKENKDFRYEHSNVVILAKALEIAFDKVGCQLKCFDWLSYNSDFHRKKQNMKAA